MDENLTVDFLIYSYFSISKTEKWDTALDKVISRAFIDATQRGASAKVPKKLTDSYGKQYQNARSYLKDQIKVIFSNSCKEHFDAWHKRNSLELSKKQGDSGYFTVGNAQKWINMSIKYVYLLKEIIEPESEFNSRINECEKLFHIPVDSYILEAIWYIFWYKKTSFKYANDANEDQIKELILSKNTVQINKERKYDSSKVNAWSNWKNYEYYCKLQDELRTFTNHYDSPLVWENNIWIYVANRRNGLSDNIPINDYAKGFDDFVKK